MAELYRPRSDGLIVNPAAVANDVIMYAYKAIFIGWYKLHGYKQSSILILNMMSLNNKWVPA